MGIERKNSIYKTIMLIIITAMITFLVTSIGVRKYYIGVNEKNISETSKKIADGEYSNELLIKTQILKKALEKKYIGDLNEQKMIESALQGYVAGLGDTYTEYLTEEEYEELMVSVTGNYVGIGIYMSANSDGNIVVLLPIEGSPAEKAGLKSGDIIVKVDEIECKGMELGEVSNKIKGKEGTEVNITVLRENQNLNFTIERKTVELKYIDSKVLENNIGYIQMLSFDEECTEKFKEELEKLKEQNINGLIIDLRDNGGGLVEEAIKLAELFIPQGNIIMKSYDKDEKETVVTSTSKNTENLNIVILVNENSASATEIFTAAMKDNKKATIIGKNTFGKGVMQELQKIQIGGALKVTIEEFKTPNGDAINKVGIAPDIEINGDEEQLQTAINKLN